MPRVKIGSPDAPRKVDAKLVGKLVDELEANRASGQPFIYEETFPTGKIRVLVLWDEWKDLPLEERTNIILAAIEKSDGSAYRDKVALASGLTIPEAYAAGMLPYRIIAAPRKTDAVTLEQCQVAELAEGASRLSGQCFGFETLLLPFPTEEAAEACKRRLIERLPGSDDIWVVLREVSAQDLGQA